MSKEYFLVDTPHKSESSRSCSPPPFSDNRFTYYRGCCCCCSSRETLEINDDDDGDRAIESIISDMFNQQNHLQNIKDRCNAAINYTAAISGVVVAIILTLKTMLDSLYGEDSTRTAALHFASSAFPIVAGFVPTICKVIITSSEEKNKHIEHQLQRIKQRCAQQQPSSAKSINRP